MLVRAIQFYCGGEEVLAFHHSNAVFRFIRLITLHVAVTLNAVFLQNSKPGLVKNSHLVRKPMQAEKVMHTS